MSGWTVLNNTFVSVENGVLINGGRDHVITGNRFENVSGAPIYLVDECPTGKIMDSALLRAYGEVKKAAQDWPAWNKYNLSEYANLSGKYTGMRFFRLRLVNAADIIMSCMRAAFRALGCTAGGSRFEDNTFCEISGPFCTDHGKPPRCTNTTSVFARNTERC